MNKTSIDTLNIKLLKFEIIYNVIKKISSDDQDFCDNCVFLNRAILNSTTLELPVATGCSNGSCKPNLKLEGMIMKVPQKLIIGLTKTVSISYTISNLGESAYFPKLEIEIPNAVKFSITPASCKKVLGSEAKIICKIKSVSLKHDEKSLFNITLDVSEVRDTEIKILAASSSSGEEVDESDNLNSIIIRFDEESRVEIQR